MTKTQQLSTLLLFSFCGALLLLGQEHLPSPSSISGYAADVVLSLLLGVTAALGLRWKRLWLSLAVGAIVYGRGQALYLLREPLTALWPFLLSVLASALTERCLSPKWYRFGLCYGIYFLAAFAGGYLLLLHPKDWLCFEPVRAAWLSLAADAALWSVGLKDDYTNQICKLMPIATAPGPSKQLQSMVINLSLRDKYLKRNRLVWTITANLAALGLLLRQSRVQSILREGIGSWLAWRRNMLAANLTGDLSAAGSLFLDAVLIRCPLSRIHAADGLWPTLLALLLMAAIFVLMFLILLQMPDRRIYKPICRGLLLCLLVKTLLALAADIFLIHPAQVQAPFLSTPWDLVTVVIFFFLSSSPDERSILASTVERRGSL